MSFYHPNQLRHPYAKAFLSQVKRFCAESRLLNFSEKVLIAVSGGVDSMALLVVMRELMKAPVHVIHFDHGLRAKSNKEALALGDWCQELGIKFESIPLDLTKRNFEMKAREARYQALKNREQDFDAILLAHHINDSLEWKWMQSLKSGGKFSALGIPVKRAKFIRPFHAVTKEQILRFAQVIKLNFFFR